MTKYEEILDEFGVTLLPAPPEMDADAWYLPKNNIIFIKTNLSEIRRDEVLSHEIEGHVLLQHDPTQLHTPVAKIKMESDADKAMIHSKVIEYLESCLYIPDFIDVYNFLEVRGLPLSLYDTAEKEINNCLMSISLR